MKIIKPRIFTAVFVLLLLLSASALASVKIDSDNFPDEHFRSIVKTFDQNKNGSLSLSEIKDVTRISCENQGIASLKGIEYFTYLDELDCDGNNLTSLNLSKNTSLRYLQCKDNQLTSLNLSKLKYLRGMSCDGNKLTAMDFSGNPELSVIRLNDNQLSALNVSCLPDLDTLDCKNNKLTELDLSKNPKLTILDIQDNRISSLDLSSCPWVYFVNCGYNNMRTLTLRNNHAIYYLYACGNNYDTLDFSTSKLLDWVVKHGTRTGSCSYQKWETTDPSVTAVIPSGTKVITRTEVTCLVLDQTKVSVVRTKNKPEPILQLTATVSPVDATDPSVSWSSSNTKVATVDKSGKVTIHKTGGAIITCTSNDDNILKASCKISVKNKLVSRITLNKKKATLKKGKTYQLKIKSIRPSDAFNQNVKWSSSNKKVASVDQTGKVTAIGKGTCIITCAAKDGSGKKITCKIMVK